MDRENAREFINSQPPTFLQAAKQKGYVCPECNNGTGADGDGMTKKPGSNHYKCFKCGLYADVIELYGIANSIEGYNEQLTAAATYYGETIDGAYTPRRSTAQEDFSEENRNPAKSEQKTHTHTDTHKAETLHLQQENTQEPDYLGYIQEANKRLSETDYWKNRGLSLETCNHFLIGYDPAWKNPKAPNAPATPRLIVPTSKHSYLARDTRAELTEKEQNYKKMKVGNVRIFNSRALCTAQKPVLIVEGELDAASIYEVGGEAIATGSTANKRKIVDAIKEYRPAHPVIIALDNDEAGTKAGIELEGLLKEAGILSYRRNPCGEHKDANEALQADREELRKNVQQITEEIMGIAEELQKSKAKEYREKNSAASHLQDFIDGITASVNTPAISTGYKRLDEALDGGLYEGLYTIGAISSLGKTTFIAQMADQIAQSGQDILYISLEMARSEIMSKSISRHTVEEILENGGDTRNAKTARGITDGKRYAEYNPAEHDTIQKAIRKYSEYAEHVYIVEGVGDIGVTHIRNLLQEHIAATGEKPVLIIDYMQILAPLDVRATDKQNTDRNVLELKRISRDYKIPVIAISSFNRESYRGEVTMAAFKESGAIEYSADVLLGMQLEGAGKTGFDEGEEKKKIPRSIEVKVLKNRNGRTGDKIQYNYYTLFNYFQEQEEQETNQTGTTQSRYKTR